MNKLTKLFVTFISAITLALVSFSSSFAKVEGDYIVLGSAISLTGKYSSNGVHTQNGYNMAVERINKMGGVEVQGKKYKFEIIYYDDESNPKRAAQLAERLIKQDGVHYMLGPYSSGLTKAIAPVTEKYKIPMVEANGASRSLFTKGYKYLFAVLSPANQYLEVAIDLAVEKNGGKGVKIAQAFEQDAFSQDVRLGILDAAKRTGSEIIIDDKLPKELNDMAATLAKVKAVKPDVLVVSGHTKGALTAIRQISEMKVDVPMLAMTHCDAAKLSKQHGKKSEFALCASQWHKNLSYKDKFFGSGKTAPSRDENQLHAAVVELIALDDAEIKYSTVQNWFPGDKKGKGGVYNFVTKRGICHERSKISWTQVETGSAVTWKYPSCILKGNNSIGEFYSIAVTNNFQQADTGTKMIHIGKNTKSTIISKGISAGKSQNSYRGLVQISPLAKNARNFSQCDSLLMGNKCGAHTIPYIKNKNLKSNIEHEATTSKISDEQLYYCNQRGLNQEEAVSLIVNGFCKEVLQQLPMEFAVEAQKLVGISLEGSVG